MQELEITWQRVARIWWLIVWRAALGGGILGFILGAIIGFIEGSIGWSMGTIQASSGIAGMLVSLGWAVVVVKMALRKKYIDFRLALIPRTSN
jgi:hypothetical protein